MRHQTVARTTFYDAAVDKYIGSVSQLVILGAGYDTRSYRLPTDSTVRCFEVDLPRIQSVKVEALSAAGVDTSRVTFVPADFLHEDWFEKIQAAGFEPGKPSLFLWEAVTMYLNREAVEKTLRKIAATAAGSAVAFDYFSKEVIESESPKMRALRASVSVGGEPFTFGIDNTPPSRDRIAELVRACGLSLEEQRNFGEESEKNHAMAGFAIATVGPTKIS
jgi:methyltransferase (TIGR00027 family)